MNRTATQPKPEACFMQIVREPEPRLTHWVNPEPQVRPAVLTDAETKKKLSVYSFAPGDSLEVEKPEELGLPKKCNLRILGYSYDDNNELYAITSGKVPAMFRNALTQPGAREVVFCEPLPETIAEIGVNDYKGAFTLRRVSSFPEFDERTKQIKINYKKKAA